LDYAIGVFLFSLFLSIRGGFNIVGAARSRQ